VAATGTVDGASRALTGRQLVAGEAKAEILPQQGNSVQMELTGEGSQLFEQITGRLAPDKPLGIFLDDDLVSAPNVNEQLSQNQVVISNMESLDAAKTLAIQLNAGALPIPLKTIQTAEVDATLGEETLVRGVQAGIIGILAVMVFMILYYRLPGLLASMALFTYVAVVMMIFKLGPVIGPVTVTLAGIAGFVLSVGMAVDANVLVFERLREELRGGRNLAQAIEHGFDRAWSSIRDSNIATLITCAILWWFGDQFNAQQVEGFAITLAIGVLISLFSAIIVTRTLLRAVLYTPFARRLSWFAPGVGTAREAAPKPFYFDFVKRRGIYFLISAVILIPGIISLIVPPRMEPGIEFSSGATFTLDFADETVSEDDVRDAFAEAGHSEARVQRTSDGNYIIRIDELGAVSGPPVGISPPSERDDLEAQIESQLGAFTVLNFNQVSEIVSSEIVRNALIAVAFASLAILAYISFSFRNVPKAYRYGIAAVVAALHDAVFVLGVFSIFGKAFGTEVDSLFITGILTVIGFSVHDTIVVFDRIRENQALNPNAPFDEVVNASLTETVARSINTSLTVLLTITSLLLLGSGSIDVLLWTLLIGIIAGTYSSIFIASQILVAWEDGDFSRVWRAVTPWRERPAPAEATGSS
jgi:SecD/SecF fusion protein